MKTPLGLALLSLLAASCAEDSRSTTPPPAVDVTGTWAGVWAEETETPLFGDMRLTLLQGAGGAVEGTLTMAGLPCVATHEFTGQVTGLVLEGTVEDQGLEVVFFFDARNVEAEMAELEGEFTLTGGEECTVPAGVFVLNPDIVPLTAGALEPPFADGAGAWRGLWLPQGGATPLGLELEAGASGELHGLLELEGARLALVGAWTREGLTAVAPGAGARISARFEAGEALEGEFALERADGRAPAVGRFRAVPRR